MINYLILIPTTVEMKPMIRNNTPPISAAAFMVGTIAAGTVVNRGSVESIGISGIDTKYIPIRKRKTPRNRNTLFIFLKNHSHRLMITNIL